MGLREAPAAAPAPGPWVSGDGQGRAGARDRSRSRCVRGRVARAPRAGGAADSPVRVGPGRALWGVASFVFVLCRAPAEASPRAPGCPAAPRGLRGSALRLAGPGRCSPPAAGTSEGAWERPGAPRLARGGSRRAGPHTCAVVLDRREGLRAPLGSLPPGRPGEAVCCRCTGRRPLPGGGWDLVRWGGCARPDFKMSLSETPLSFSSLRERGGLGCGDSGAGFAARGRARGC